MAAVLCDIMFSLPLRHDCANRANITLFLPRILLPRRPKSRVEQAKNARIENQHDYNCIISYNITKNTIFLSQ